MVDSEYRTYPYILEVLKDLEWDTRNPSRGGSVYTQGEFRKHDPFLNKTLGQNTPENIIVIPWEEKIIYWIVEAKRSHHQLTNALREAKKYANKINELEVEGGGVEQGLLLA